MRLRNAVNEIKERLGYNTNDVLTKLTHPLARGDYNRLMGYMGGTGGQTYPSPKAANSLWNVATEKERAKMQLGIMERYRENSAILKIDRMAFTYGSAFYPENNKRLMDLIWENRFGQSKIDYRFRYRKSDHLDTAMVFENLFPSGKGHLEVSRKATGYDHYLEWFRDGKLPTEVSSWRYVVERMKECPDLTAQDRDRILHFVISRAIFKTGASKALHRLSGFGFDADAALDALFSHIAPEK